MPSLESLPEELLLEVFRHLAELGSPGDSDDPWFIHNIPFRSNDRDEQPLTGLRAYPFLGQVCKKWKALLNTPCAKAQLWRALVVDFGHELVTAIHTPLAWSNERPSPEEYSTAFQRVSLSSAKVIDFIMDRQQTLTSLVLSNSEGFWGDGDNREYLPLSGKHDFHALHLGFLMGQLRNQLQELRLYNCNDMLSADQQGLWCLAALCPNMRILSVEGLNCRVTSQSVSGLSCLKKLESLSLIGEERSGGVAQASWIIGLDSMPVSWSHLSALSKLELRGHHLLDVVPSWLKDMRSLRHLDVSCNASIDLACVTLLTQLETLVLQNLDLSQPSGLEQQAISPLAKRFLPNLEPLSALKSLSLARNRFTRLPEAITKLHKVEILDFSGGRGGLPRECCSQFCQSPHHHASGSSGTSIHESNRELQVLSPLTALLVALPVIRIMDFRGIHKDKQTKYWSDAKCTTMKFVAAAAKLLKRRKYTSRVMIDKD